MDYLNSFRWFHHSPVCYALRYELQVCFDKTRTCEMIAKLKALCAPQIKRHEVSVLWLFPLDQEFCQGLCHVKGIVHLPWNLGCVKNQESGTIRRGGIDDRSIYDIRDQRWRYIWYTRYECFSLQVFVAVTKVFDTGSVLWNMSFLLKSYLEGKRRRCVSMMASKLVWWPATLSLRFCYLD